MQAALKPKDESQRLAALREYQLLDSDQEQDFDEIVALASTICEVPISLITLIDDDRQWFKSKLGVDGHEADRDVTFCAHAILGDDVMMVNDATKDIRFFDNPFVTGNPDIRFYAGMPLINEDGYKLGTLCVLDRKPKTLTEAQLFSLKVLSKQVIKQMELHKKMKELERLNDNNHKLLSLIGHDMKSPLSSLYGLLELLEQHDLPIANFKKMIPELKKGFVAANGLLSNLMEWATSQFTYNEIRKIPFSLESVANFTILGNRHVFIHKQNTVVNTIDPNMVAMCDENMVKAVMRNLLMNANKFTQEGTITVAAEEQGDFIHVSVTDTGVGIAPERLSRIFSWNDRFSTNGTNGEKGSGFGLQVCKEFIERNGGRMWVESKVGAGSTFYFSLPCS